MRSGIMSRREGEGPGTLRKEKGEGRGWVGEGGKKRWPRSCLVWGRGSYKFCIDTPVCPRATQTWRKGLRLSRRRSSDLRPRTNAARTKPLQCGLMARRVTVAISADTSYWQSYATALPLGAEVCPRTRKWRVQIRLRHTALDSCIFGCHLTSRT